MLTTGTAMLLLVLSQPSSLQGFTPRMFQRLRIPKGCHTMIHKNSFPPKILLSTTSSDTDQPCQSYQKESSVIRELIQNYPIEPHDLSEMCVEALTQYPLSAAKNALDIFVSQQKRRELNNLGKITNPSAYIMTVLRNATHRTSSTNNVYTNHEVYNEKRLKVTKTPMISATLPRIPTKINDFMRKDDAVNPPPSASKSKSSTLYECNKETISNDLSGFYQQLERSSNKMKISHTQSPDEKISMDIVDRCVTCLYRLEKPVKSLAGVGVKTEHALNNLGVFTLCDLLWHFPRSFIDRSVLQNICDISDGDSGTFSLKVNSRSKRTVFCTDENENQVDISFAFGNSRRGVNLATAEMTKFSNNGGKMIVSGRVKRIREKYTITNPDMIIPFEKASEVLGIEPVYKLSSGLSKVKLQRAIDEALNVLEGLRCLPESLPDNVLSDLSWPKLIDALKIAHKPETIEQAGINSPARNRLAFEELCIQQAKLALIRWDLKYSGEHLKRKETTYRSWQDSPLVTLAIKSLPFELTSSQMECLQEMWSDSISENNGKMARLLQGDAGSGKTVLAYLLGLGCIESRQGGGRIVAIMAPTQILALQHHRKISDFVKSLDSKGADSPIKNISVELFTSSVIGKNRDILLSKLENSGDSEAIFLIGTHAIITPDSIERLQNLQSPSPNKTFALAIVDEEQRFGVQQRQALAICSAHTLYMSATPIPRTIGLKESSILDITFLDSEPKYIETTIASSEDVEKAVDALKNKIDNAGSKCFWVLPRIGTTDNIVDDSTNTSQSSVLTRYEMLKNALGHDRVACIHGRMKVKDREEQLVLFANSTSKVDVLVSTTVIEVGIDIPNVNILVVEDAHCFGLSALYQLRGRIGRKGSNSNLTCQCLLLSTTENFSSQEDSVSSLKRLDILRETMSGKEIAEADFYLRGPGELIGLSQSGVNEGKAIHSDYHWEMIEAATRIGRAFILNGNNAMDKIEEIRRGSLISPNEVLINLLKQGKFQSFYTQTNASSIGGFTLRFMMALFGSGRSKTSEKNDCSTFTAIKTLQYLSASKDELTEEDDVVNEMILSFVKSLPNNSETPASNLSITTSADTLQQTDQKFIQLASSNTMNKESVLMTAPSHPVASLSTITENRVDLVKEAVLFLLLDVETTGLDDSDHVIQIAAKVLGSDHENDMYSEYILPPVKTIPEKITELTGITYDFLRYGGCDGLGKQRTGQAREFREVFLDFQAFCLDRANGKPIAMIAHNAKFDRRMIEGELKRWRYGQNLNSNHDQKSTVPTLNNLFATSVDSVYLFRDKRLWSSSQRPGSLPRPKGFNLEGIYSHVFHEKVHNSHNAVGDIRALERLLLHEAFIGWKQIANDIQVPFVKIE